MAREYREIEDNFDATSLARDLTGEDPSAAIAATIGNTDALKAAEELLDQPDTIPGLQAVPQEPVVVQEKVTGKRGATANVFKNLIPPTDRVAIYKISREGHKGIVGDYGYTDLSRSRGIDMFIKDYIVPTYGGGNYIVEVKAMDGKVKQEGLVNIPEPIMHKDNTPSLQQILSAQQTMQREAEQRSANQMKEAMGMMAMFREMLPKGEKGDSSSSMMPMMMMMMMMNQQKPTGPDPVTQMLLQKLMSREEQSMMPPPLPIPLMSPSYSSPERERESLSDIVKILAETMRAAQPQPQQNDLIQTLLATALSKTDNNSITTKDLLGIIPMIKEMFDHKEGTSTFNEYLEGLMRLDEIRGERSSSEDKSMWAGLAEMVVGVARDIKMQQMKLEMVERTNRLQSRNSRRVLPTQIKSAQTESMPITTPQTEELQQPTEKPRSKVPEIPVSFRKYTHRMKEAHAKNDEPALVMALIEGLLHLRETSSEWAPYIEELFVAASKGDKVRAIKFIEVFLFSFAKKKLISLELVGTAKQIVEMNWDEIIESTGIVKAFQDDSTIVTDNTQEPVTEAKSESGKSNGNSSENAEIEAEDDEESDEAEVDPNEYGIPESELANPVSVK